MEGIYEGVLDLEKDWPTLWEKFSFVPEDQRKGYILGMIMFVGMS